MEDISKEIVKEIGFDRMLACAKTNILQNQGTKIQRLTLASPGHMWKINECAKYVIKMQRKRSNSLGPKRAAGDYCPMATGLTAYRMGFLWANFRPAELLCPRLNQQIFHIAMHLLVEEDSP